MTQQSSLHSVGRPKRLLMPAAPVLVLDGRRFVSLSADGEPAVLTDDQARALIAHTMPICCHGPAIARHLNIPRFQSYDVLELFAFVRPGHFTVPTPRGIARSLNLLEPLTAEDQCLSLRDSARHLIADLSAPLEKDKSNPAAIAAMMGMMSTSITAPEMSKDAPWPWAEIILAALGREADPPTRGEIRTAMKIWEKLPEWAVHAPEPAPGHHGVSADEAKDRLHKMLLRQKKEERPQQMDFTAAIADAFAPRDHRDSAHVMLAEAGTGTGKTLGYLAPATVWAEKNGGPVWISTYTRNLQRQVEAELDRLYDDPVTKARKVVVRKGRENYLCLLNLEDASQAPSIDTNPLNATALGLMLRWAAATDDGDMAGKDFPGWLVSLLGWSRVNAFADRRGECIYSACPHFNKCFIEKSVRKSKRADIVIANHALVMHQAATDAPGAELPSRFVFDEGHHIFDAADSAYAAHLNGTETSELRRWILGVETQKKSRARGLKRRLEDLIANDEAAARDVEELIEAARCLPAPLWRQRLAEDAPKGAVEEFLRLARQQVLARAKDAGSNYSIETPALPPVPELLAAAAKLAAKLRALRLPMLSLVKRLENKLVDDADTLDSDMRERLQFMSASLKRRADGEVGAWIEMLTALDDAATPGAVDWLENTRLDGKDHDIGYYRYALDPSALFAESLRPHLQGAAITSATLRDPTDDDAAGWQGPLVRTGLPRLAAEAKLFHVPSPFDYKAQTKIFVIKDVRKEDAGEVAGALNALFTAAGGGALGIFTSIQRLRGVHKTLAPKLEGAGLHLYAQHVDPLDTGTLVDIFREEENACLLGTDATRDGIDVPGRSLRLVVYDRVPWPRPTILHKARRDHFGKSYDDMLTRFKLKQAYGRLIRTASDKGVFVMLDSALPTRLLSAFPEGVEVERIGLSEATARIKEFLADA